MEKMILMASYTYLDTVSMFLSPSLLAPQPVHACTICGHQSYRSGSHEVDFYVIVAFRVKSGLSCHCRASVEL